MAADASPIADALTLGALLREREEDELVRETARLAAVLAWRGVAKGARIGLAVSPGPDGAKLALACGRIGGVIVPLGSDTAKRLEAAAVTHVIAESPFEGAFSPWIGSSDGPIMSEEMPYLRACWRWDEIVTATPSPEAVALAEAMEARVKPADDLAILFEAGAGLIYTHGGLLRTAAAASIAGLARSIAEGTAPSPRFVDARVDEAGLIELRGPALPRAVCGRTREETFTPDRFWRTGRTGWLADDGRLHLS